MVIRGNSDLVDGADYQSALQAGYAVIFVYRKGSIQPFTKGLPSAQLLDILTDVLVDGDKAGNGVHVKDEASAILQTAVRKARECNEQGTLLRIPYITLFEYLQVLNRGSCDQN